MTEVKRGCLASSSIVLRPVVYSIRLISSVVTPFWHDLRPYAFLVLRQVEVCLESPKLHSVRTIIHKIISYSLRWYLSMGTGSLPNLLPTRSEVVPQQLQYLFEN